MGAASTPVFDVKIFCDVLCVAHDGITVKNRATGRVHRFAYADILIGSSDEGEFCEVVMPRALADAEDIRGATVPHSSARYVVAKMPDAQLRLFTGRYDSFTPVTTGDPFCAKIYVDENVAVAVAAA
ncbi:MAG: hypothetical protein ACRETL_01840, partial [Gammaproteobacteria bacterium]